MVERIVKVASNINIDKIEFEGEILRFPNREKEYLPFPPGHSRKYRGKHRSETHGAGALAFFRSLWMQRYRK